MPAQPRPYISPEEYLEQEDRAEFRSEYFDGEVFAMAGASWNHSRIMTNLVKELTSQMGDGPCEIVFHDTRVQAGSESTYLYPDIVGICSPPLFSGPKNNILLNPELIIEVLSPSTEKIDRGAKFLRYREMPSIQEYVMVSQEKLLVEHYIRKPESEWNLKTYQSLADELHLLCGDCHVLLERIYDRIQFDITPSLRIHK